MRTKKEPLHLDKVARVSFYFSNRNNMSLQRWTGDDRPQWVVCYVITQGRERNALAWSLQTPD